MAPSPRLPWHYSPELRALLEDHGISPPDGTPPRLVRDYLSGLYRFEIRRLRGRFIDGHVAQEDYIPHVIELRKKYVALSLTPAEWEKACSGAVRQ